MKKILFISHDATRSGAPLYLLNLIQWFKDNYQIECLILLKSSGELYTSFANSGPTLIWDAHYISSNFKNKIAAKIGYRNLEISYQNRIIKQIKSFKPDLVIANTVVSNKLAFLFKKSLACPFVAIYHEMKFSAEFYYGEHLSKKYINLFDKIIVINQNIKEFLKTKFLIESEKIIIIAPFISLPPKKENLVVIKPEYKFNILLSGFGGWQKGFDLLGPLLAICKYKELGHLFSFTWVGHIPFKQMKMLEFELSQIDACDLINFPGIVSDMSKYYMMASLLLLLSKEDSFPLTCIEAANYGIPILAFEKSGGINEFINRGGGVSVPFMDLNEIVNKIYLFATDFGFYNEKSNIAQKLSTEYTIDKIAPQILNVLFKTGISLQKK